MTCVSFCKVASIFFCVVAYSSLAQKQGYDNETFLSNSARDFILFEDYESALKVYQSLDSIRPNSPDYTYNLALCIFFAVDKPQSLLHFLRAHQLGYKENKIYYYLGQAYQFNYDMDNAEYNLERYRANLQPNHEYFEEDSIQVSQLLHQISQSKALLDRSLSVEIENLGEIINSPFADYVPITLLNDSILIFTSRRKQSTGGEYAQDGQHYEDVYMSTKNDKGEWQTPIHFPGVNSNNHDAVVAISEDEKELYFYKSQNGGDIYKSVVRKNGMWSKPKPLTGINSRYWEGSIYIAEGGDTIFFSSDRPGGIGESDLYMATKDKKGRWRNIKNMGPEINTPSDEDAPYLHKDGTTFFFSSKGHDSMGGYDVFSVKRLDPGTWTPVKNLGFPINTVDHDIYFQLNSTGSMGYFTSYRHSNFSERSIGEKDIFRIKRPRSSPAYFVFKGRVYDKETREPIPAIAKLKNLDDSTQAELKLVTDINSGKFRFDLRFENRYTLTVEIGGKIYYSKELHFPYRADQFEDFIDIALTDIPRYTVKLNDVINENLTSPDEGPFRTNTDETILLVRKIPPNDPALRELLTSNRIPVSFRKKLLRQLENTAYLDTPEEGNETKSLINDLPDDVNASTEPFMMKLDVEVKNKITKPNVTDAFRTPNKSDRDSVIWESISTFERESVMRVVHRILNDTSSASAVVDQLLFQNLKPDARIAMNKLIARQVLKQIKNDSLTKEKSDSISVKLYTFIDQAHKAIQNENGYVQTFAREGWGLLHTFETSRFQFKDTERLVFEGNVVTRSNGLPAPNQKLLVTDDSGLIYSQVKTSQVGSAVFSGLQPGKRYHILIDDYTIALIGQSRYEMKDVVIRSTEEEYLTFYANLSPEKKRAVDRWVATKMRRDSYEKNPVSEYEDQEQFAKLSQREKEFITRIRNYLAADRMESEAFLLDTRAADQYNQMDLDTRDVFNRYVAGEIVLSNEDSLFFSSLTGKEKNAINQLRQSRTARKTIVEDILLSGSDSDYWYVMDELNTTLAGHHGNQKVTAIITHNLKFPGRLQVALMDQFKQIVHVTECDSAGDFSFLSLKPGRYKVLINKGENIVDIKNYRLTGVKISISNDDFYNKLSPTEKRMIDRIMAIRMANQSYSRDASLYVDDKKKFDLLTAEERQFIERIQLHLFADSVVSGNAYLDKRDNHHYYNSLSVVERDVVNRLVVSRHYGESVSMPSMVLEGKDKVFFETLSLQQKTFIDELQSRRKAKADLFAENPILLVEKAWVLLDSITKTKVNFPILIKGDLVDVDTDQPLRNVPMMLSNSIHEIAGIVSTDSLGHFVFLVSTTNERLNLLAENNGSIFSGRSRFKLKNLRVVASDANLHLDSLIAPLEIYFDLNCHSLTKAAKAQVEKWLGVNATRLKNSTVVIAGHADRRGTPLYNMALGKRRAQSTLVYLKSRNSFGNNTTIISYGESVPKYPFSKDPLNRRVEIQFRE